MKPSTTDLESVHRRAIWATCRPPPIDRGVDTRTNVSRNMLDLPWLGMRSHTHYMPGTSGNITPRVTRWTCCRSVDRLHMSKNCVFVDIFTVCRGSGQKLPQIYHVWRYQMKSVVTVNSSTSTRYTRHIATYVDRLNVCTFRSHVDSMLTRQDVFHNYPWTCLTGQNWTLYPTKHALVDNSYLTY